MQKFHWGHAILIFFIGYIATLVFIMYQTTQVDHDLVVEDYYAQDLSYQKKYEKIENANYDNKNIAIEWDDNTQSLLLVFDSKELKNGTVKLYNPGDRFKDKIYPFNITKGDSLLFENINLSQGRWKVQTDWKENDKLYFLQKELYIP